MLSVSQVVSKDPLQEGNKDNVTIQTQEEKLTFQMPLGLDEELGITGSPVSLTPTGTAPESSTFTFSTVTGSADFKSLGDSTTSSVTSASSLNMLSTSSNTADEEISTLRRENARLQEENTKLSQDNMILAQSQTMRLLETECETNTRNQAVIRELDLLLREKDDEISDLRYELGNLQRELTRRNQLYEENYQRAYNKYKYLKQANTSLKQQLEARTAQSKTTLVTTFNSSPTLTAVSGFLAHETSTQFATLRCMTFSSTVQPSQTAQTQSSSQPASTAMSQSEISEQTSQSYAAVVRGSSKK